MNRLFDWLSKNIDKVAHFSVSIILTIVLGGIIFHSIIFGALASFGIGILKEVIDSKRGEIFDKKDLVADFFGDVIGIIILLLL